MGNRSGPVPQHMGVSSIGRLSRRERSLKKKGRRKIMREECRCVKEDGNYVMGSNVNI
jgi:hypothetical protein